MPQNLFLNKVNWNYIFMISNVPVISSNEDIYIVQNRTVIIQDCVRLTLVVFRIRFY